ncbi:MAG: 30S ribosomal protein S8 [Pleurocapsa minor GSE-CHR-MK-17-07R]|jgi:small subunit ribosomal protein S8|nr:30S ribosomal protein S8 [Pleurocapsa minor GSE-CHR-MK 17-07R]
MMSDPIADLLSRIRNALMAGKSTVEAPTSKIKVEIARILQEEGYIESYEVIEQQPFGVLSITLKYHGARRERKPVISNITRVSKPGRRVYRGRMDLPRVMSGIGIAIVTTPKGVMTAAQARRERVGGEVLCYVW